jgi:predicted NAD/FAD-dependent oxidoreductase
MYIENKDYPVIIVGGGIAGLLAANILHKKGIEMIVLDKGKGIGGRLATRRILEPKFGEGIFDYGAQYFTVRDNRFREWVDKWEDAGIVKSWSKGFFTAVGEFKENGEPRYFSTNGIREIAKYLSADIVCKTQTKVDNISFIDRRWNVTTSTKQLFKSRYLVLTPPIPQILELIHKSKLSLNKEGLTEIQKIKYEPCLAVLALLKSTSKIPEPGGLWGSGEPIQWIADNQKKGISPTGVAVTIHAGPVFSQEYWHADDEEIHKTLVDTASKWLGSNVAAYQIHRWRFSQSIGKSSRNFVFFDTPAPLIVTGDAFCGGRIEGAAISGISAGEFLSDHLINSRFP